MTIKKTHARVVMYSPFDLNLLFLNANVTKKTCIHEYCVYKARDEKAYKEYNTEKKGLNLPATREKDNKLCPRSE